MLYVNWYIAYFLAFGGGFMQLFLVTARVGHYGSGKHGYISRVVRANNALGAYESGRRLAGVKAVEHVKRINEADAILHLLDELRDHYITQDRYPPSLVKNLLSFIEPIVTRRKYNESSSYKQERGDGQRFTSSANL